MAELTDQRCRVCNWRLDPGVMICPNCAEPVEGEAAAAAQPSPPLVNESASLMLVLPDHSTLPLVEGYQIELGRDTGVAQIDSTLAPYTDVSRHHAVVELVDGAVVLTAVAVQNTTAVDEVEVDGTARVGVDQRIRLAEHCWLQVRRA